MLWVRLSQDIVQLAEIVEAYQYECLRRVFELDGSGITLLSGCALGYTMVSGSCSKRKCRLVSWRCGHFAKRYLRQLLDWFVELAGL